MRSAALKTLEKLLVEFPNETRMYLEGAEEKLKGDHVRGHAYIVCIVCIVMCNCRAD